MTDSCLRQFPEFGERARKRIRTYLKSCRRNKRSRDSLTGVDTTNRPMPPHLTSAAAEQILAQACENENQNAKRLRMGLEPISQPVPIVRPCSIFILFIITAATHGPTGPCVFHLTLPIGATIPTTATNAATQPHSLTILTRLDIVCRIRNVLVATFPSQRRNRHLQAAPSLQPWKRRWIRQSPVPALVVVPLLFPISSGRLSVPTTDPTPLLSPIQSQTTAVHPAVHFFYSIIFNLLSLEESSSSSRRSI